jgi:hypothetical protein
MVLKKVKKNFFRYFFKNLKGMKNLRGRKKMRYSNLNFSLQDTKFGGFKNFHVKMGLLKIIILR